MSNTDWLDSVRREAKDVSALQDVGVRELLKDADVILGFDKANDARPVVFFGKQRFVDIAKSGRSTRLAMIGLNYDSRTRELEWLCAAVLTLKGRCEYEATPPHN